MQVVMLNRSLQELWVHFCIFLFVCLCAEFGFFAWFLESYEVLGQSHSARGYLGVGRDLGVQGCSEQLSKTQWQAGKGFGSRERFWEGTLGTVQGWDSRSFSARALLSLCSVARPQGIHEEGSGRKKSPFCRQGKPVTSPRLTIRRDTGIKTLLRRGGTNKVTAHRSSTAPVKQAVQPVLACAGKPT